ncbi:MAG: riboflavin synthase, alpha subunit [Solirubrobacterales bacterium]|jgi:riboflavin synthase|nr:riboflavin synthase, alpha subunit [Solirubrobacterales bacterium]
MFTGLITEVGRIEELRADRDGARLRIVTELAGELREGDSVAVNGVCLTATAVEKSGFATEAMPETLQRSSLGELRGGDAVNLELALRAADRLGGHVVQGHVDGTGIVARVQAEGISRVVEIEAQPELTRYLVEKGSVAVDGVSLTVSSLDDDTFAVSLIPETLARTTLGALAAGSKVNIEVDVLAKHVERLLGART